MRRVARGLVHGVAGGAAVAIFLIVILPLSRLRGAAKRRRGELPAILWGPVPIVNIRYSSLADRRYGYRSDTLVYDVYRINARRDFDYVLDRARGIPLVRQLVPYAAFLWAGARYDLFGFFFDGGLLGATPFWRIELSLLRLAGKRIVVYPYGSDARLASVTRALRPWNAYTEVPVGEEDRDESEVLARHRAFDRYADVMLGCNDIVEELPRCDGILPYPFPVEEWDTVVAPASGVCTVVHPSNHRHYKGTRFLVAAVEQLRAEGLPVELVLVEGVPLEEARATYERADVVVTDLLIGGYALAAIEAMALGKPVVAYMPERLRQLHPEWQGVPIVHADPETVVDVLRGLVLDPEQRSALGAQGPSYVRQVHSLDAVGAIMDDHYRRLWSLPPG